VTAFRGVGIHSAAFAGAVDGRAILQASGGYKAVMMRPRSVDPEFFPMRPPRRHRSSRRPVLVLGVVWPDTWTSRRKRLAPRTTGTTSGTDVADQVAFGVRLLDLGYRGGGEGGYACELTRKTRGAAEAAVRRDHRLRVVITTRWCGADRPEAGDAPMRCEG